ncbi:MAG: M48 family metallopeptidase [Elusimicrobiales bacterium]
MADTKTTISEIQLFIEDLKKDMPEIFSQRQNQPALPFVKKLLFRGELYDISPADAKDSLSGVILENGQARITCDFAKVHPKNALETWLKAQAEAIIAERAAFWGGQMSLSFSRVCVKDQKTLWGSCSGRGNLNFSWRLIKAPPAVLDYLIIHELAHLVHMNHGDEYWNYVAQWHPDHKACRRWLNDHKNELMSDIEVDKIDSPQQAAPQPPAGGGPSAESA